jgi:hypothetical protein
MLVGFVDRNLIVTQNVRWSGFFIFFRWCSLKRDIWGFMLSTSKEFIDSPTVALQSSDMLMEVM